MRIKLRNRVFLNFVLVIALFATLGAVLGAVLAGWATLMFILVRGPLASGISWALPALAVPLAVWFILDTGMSLVLGYPTHALFNVPFALALGVPLWRLWVIDRSTSGTVTSP